jgi:hypothetical protein
MVSKLLSKLKDPKFQMLRYQIADWEEKRLSGALVSPSLTSSALMASLASAGGGGGSAEVGYDGIYDCNNTRTGNASKGGNGLSYSINGTATNYAGGGGGSVDDGNTQGSGGIGGGGQGRGGSTSGDDGTFGTGGGGGGTRNVANQLNVFGGNGGGGVVIISYAGSQKFTGGSVSPSGGNTIHTFTSSGTLSPL